MKNGLYCDGGKRWFSIGSEGRVYTCNSLIYHPNAFLGNIITEDIKLRTEEWNRCPVQKCYQICDRHWSKKQVYEDDKLIDSQDVVNPDPYKGIKNPASILFAPTWKCNYSCVYCVLPTKKVYPNIPDACDTFPYQTWIDAFKRFFTTNEIGGGIWHTNGGEPLFYDGIEHLFKFFKEQNFTIALTSNITADVYKKIVAVAPPSSFGIINCSLHPSDKNFRLDQFKSRVHLLKVLGYPISVNFVGHPDQIMLAPDYAEWCKSIGVGFSLIPLLGNNDGIFFKTINDYPEALRNIINKYSTPELKDDNRFIDGARVNTK